MAFFSTIFNEFFYRPLFNALVFLYNSIPGSDFGVAIILLTLLIRFLLFPLSQKAIDSQRALSFLQPKIKEIQEKYKNNKEKQTKAIMEFYQQHKISPFSGCLPLLIQLPVLFALYRVFARGLDPQELNILYSFVKAPEAIHTMSLGFLDLSRSGSETPLGIALVLVTGLLQFVQAKTLSPSRKTASPPPASDKPDFSRMMQDQMTYIMPVFTVAFLWNFKTGLALYWLTTTVFSIGQQLFLKGKQDAIK